MWRKRWVLLSGDWESPSGHPVRFHIPTTFQIAGRPSYRSVGLLVCRRLSGFSAPYAWPPGEEKEKSVAGSGTSVLGRSRPRRLNPRRPSSSAQRWLGAGRSYNGRSVS
ncbi:unnamed protein product [Prunus armeniaca]